MCSPLILSVDGTSGPALLAMEALVYTTYTLHSPNLPLNLASLTPSFIVSALHLAVTAPEAGSGRLYVEKPRGRTVTAVTKCPSAAATTEEPEGSSRDDLFSELLVSLQRDSGRSRGHLSTGSRSPGGERCDEVHH